MSDDVIATAKTYRILSSIAFWFTMFFMTVSPWVIVAYWDKWFLVPYATTTVTLLWMLSGLSMVNRNLQVEVQKQQLLNNLVDHAIGGILGNSEQPEENEDE